MVCPGPFGKPQYTHSCFFYLTLLAFSHICFKVSPDPSRNLQKSQKSLEISRGILSSTSLQPFLPSLSFLPCLQSLFCLKDLLLLIACGCWRWDYGGSFVSSPPGKSDDILDEVGTSHGLVELSPVGFFPPPTTTIDVCVLAVVNALLLRNFPIAWQLAIRLLLCSLVWKGSP